MTLLRERERVEVTKTVVDHTSDWMFAIVGVIAGLVGLYMYAVPADWFLGGLVEGWYLGMFVAAGVLIGIALAMYGRKSYAAYGSWSGAEISGIVFSVLAFAAAVWAALVWIL
jgi:hypothetical protein